MAKSERQIERIEYERNLTVTQRNDMLQKGRHKLSLREQKCVLYAISKIKPDDTSFSEYTFDIKDFYAVCGLESDTYTEFKAMMKGLSDRSWWAEIDDEGTESVVRWFSTVRTNKKSGKATIKFHEDMMPFLLNLVSSDEFYTSVTLKYILPMSSQYAPKLYELLKSYSNNDKWFFETAQLKKLLDAENYKNFNDFQRRVLDPAVEDINKFTDLNVIYKTEKEGRRVSRVIFYIFEKKPQARLEAEREGAIVLDGQMDFEDYAKQMREDEEEQRIRQFIQDNLNAK